MEEMDIETSIDVPFVKDTFTKADKLLTDEEKIRLKEQDKRLVSQFAAEQLEMKAQRHWDLFYKRNETRFFKDRHWTKREFKELIMDCTNNINENSFGLKKLLEVGCGVGNLIFPLIEEEKLNNVNKYFYYACDFSPRAIDFVRKNELYDEKYIHAFQCDITTNNIKQNIPENSLDLVTMIFVLSAIHPDKFEHVIQNVCHLLKPGGVVLFRDYGRYDMAQLRFKAGHKISENFYMRQDGTRSYYFSEQELADLFRNNGFDVVENAYIHRRTLNIKEGINVPRIFLQGKFRKSQIDINALNIHLMNLN